MTKCITTIEELHEELKQAYLEHKTIGLVPTMGALHQGHASLIKASTKENDVTVVSVFVNPTQFGPNEDFDKYPRTLEADVKLASDNQATIVFAPKVDTLYPSKDPSYLEVFGNVTKVLCAKSRPIHFRGVCTVVSKLFNIVRPTRAYFGQKDAQQVLVIKRMVKDFFIPVEIRVMPIIREQDGLALSSRNRYLTNEQRAQALVLSQSLKHVAARFAQGERNVKVLRQEACEMIEKASMAKIDYVEILALDNLDPIETIENKALVALAVYFGNTRLIDNTILE